MVYLHSNFSGVLRKTIFSQECVSAVQGHSFLPRDASAERGDATVSLSVCLSARPSVTFRYRVQIYL